MSKWRWLDTRENNLRRVIERVARTSREAAPIEKEIFAAMKPRGGWCGILLFCAVVIGVVVAEKLNAFPLGTIAAVALLGALVCIYSRGIPSGLGVALLLGGIVFAVASNTLHSQLKGIPIEDMVDSPLLVDVEGVLSTTPRSADESICEFDLFGPPRKGDVFNLRRTNGGGTLRVHIQGGSGSLVAGDHVRIRGQLRFYQWQKNPGERARRADSYDDLPATLYVSDKALIKFVPQSDGIGSFLFRLRHHLRQRLSQTLDVFGSRSESHRAFFGAVFLGERGNGFPVLRRMFASVGLAHVLAISGLHLAALAATIGGIAIILFRSNRIRLLMTGAVVLGYASLLDPRTSVQRAGITLGIVLLGLAIGGRWRAAPLIGVVAVIVLLLEPAALYGAGFQLSFGVTAALAIIAPRARQHWFGNPDHLGSSRSGIIRSRLLDGFSAALVAWLVATPLVMHHFAQFAWLGIPATLAASIPMAAVLAFGFPALLLGMVWLPAAEVGAVVIDPAAGLVINIAATLESWMPAWFVVAIPWWHVLVIEAGVVITAMSESRRWRAVGGAIIFLALGSPIVERYLPNAQSSAAFEVCSLDVGNGSAILVRADRSAILFDAGSTSISNVGERTIVPALGALGVRQLEAIVLSHANTDHISGMPAVLDAIRVKKVIVTPHFLRAANEGDAVAKAAIRSIRQRGVPISVAARNDNFQFGLINMNVIHPAMNDKCRSANDSSIVAVLHAGVNTGTLLLCGDIEDEACAKLLMREPFLRADVMELPHHGSWRQVSRALLEHVNPSVVLQSTGRTRFGADRWAPFMICRSRIVTARDGAVSIAIQKNRMPTSYP